MAGKSSAHVVSPSTVFCTIGFTERRTTCMSFQVIKVDILLCTCLYLWTKMAYYSEVLTQFQMSNNIAINKYKRYKRMQSLILNVNKILKSSLGVCATLPDCFCSSSRCFVLTSPDKNIGKRHCSAFPSVARLRAFSQAAERPGNFLET